MYTHTYIINRQEKQNSKKNRDDTYFIRNLCISILFVPLKAKAMKADAVRGRYPAVDLYILKKKMLTEKLITFAKT